METSKKFIMKFGVTVCLLAILFLEGFFLYCRYIKHVSATQYAVEQLRTVQDWISHSGTQTANAKTPASEKTLQKKSISTEPPLLKTAKDAILELLKNNTLIIPENIRTQKKVSSNSSTTADAAYPKAEEEPKPEETAVPSSTPKPESEPKQEQTEPLPAAEADSTGLEIANLNDLLKLQEAAGIVQNMDGRIQLEAESILQNPELPTGCEVTSLAMALRFAGYDVSKEDLADQYLEKTAPGEVSYKTAFWGDPRQSESFGCYAPVIVKAANKYLEAQKSPQKAYNLTGTPLDDILVEIRMGYPVIVWGSMYIDGEIVFSYGWEIEGETVTWPSNEHCMLLIGFDTETNSVIVCDPLEGIVSYDKNAFQHHYDTLEKQAIVIY